MNGFDRDAAEERGARVDAWIIGVWTRFRTAIRDLVASYNDHPEGEIHPASITLETEKSIVIECRKGRTGRPQEFAILAIMIHAELRKGELRIFCTVERWKRSALPNLAPINVSTKAVKFIFDVSTESLLGPGHRQLTECEAAEELLRPVLLPEAK